MRGGSVKKISTGETGGVRGGATEANRPREQKEGAELITQEVQRSETIRHLTVRSGCSGGLRY